MHIAWKLVTQLEAGYPILAYHTAPKGIIQIDRQNLSAGRNQRTQTSRDEQGNCDLPLCAQWLPRHEIESCIRISPSLQRGPHSKVQYMDAAIRGRHLINFLV